MRPAALAVLTLFVLACGQQQPVAQTSPSPSATVSPTSTPAPSPSASATPTPSSRPYAVLATPPFAAAGATATYTLSLVGADGKVAATATAATRSGLQCTFSGVTAGVVLPPETLSATDDRVYYLDGNTGVKWLAPDGSHGAANPVPGGGSIGSTFAVSPDDQRIAVVSADYSQNPVPYRIYVEDVAGGNRVQIFSSTSSTLLPWAMGWHAGKLVLGYAPACTQGGGPFSASPGELHLVDAGTAARAATLGGSSCRTLSLPTPAGVICGQPEGSNYVVLGWDGKPSATVTFDSSQSFILALSPTGAASASCCSQDGDVVVNGTSPNPAGVLAPAQSLGFIDDSHLLIGSDTAQTQGRIYTLGGPTVPVNALGDFLGRIPGAL